ncbi:MAG: hypothetical protein O2887_10350 [Bacteroidetes bacterium]|nr:hypothetical protein [Bacteroidota bacterium]
MESRDTNKSKVNTDKHLVTYKMVSTKELDYTSTVHETVYVEGDLYQWFLGMSAWGNKKCIIEFAIYLG